MTNERELSDGRRIPRIGLGTWPLKDAEAERVVAEAIEVGYRHVDTALRYGNEDAVGRGLRVSGVDRDQVWVTTKLDGPSQGGGKARDDLRGSLDRLGLDRVDLLLIHWPQPERDLYVSTWETFIELRDEGLATSIGVSNFKPAHIDRLVAETGVVPVVNQLQISPLIARREQRTHAAGLGIAVESWSPLGGDGAHVLDNDVVRAVADRHGWSPAQTVIAWHLANDLVAIPKSANRERLAGNLAALELELDADDIAALDGLDEGPDAGVDSDAFGH